MKKDKNKEGGSGQENGNEIESTVYEEMKNNSIIQASIRWLLAPFKTIRDNWDLFRQSVKREIVQKYRGSYLGTLWNLILPMTMLIVYSFVFGVVFHAKWDRQISNSNEEFAVILFVGIMIFNLFSETINTAPLIITANPNYVKKVIYPLEILSPVGLTASMVQFLFNLVIVIAGRFIIIGNLDAYILLFPIIMIPLIMLLLGFSWILSAIGVYFRDMRQAATIITLVFGYVTPIFFPISVVPKELHWVMEINPLTTIVTSAREVLIYGSIPDWTSLLGVAIASYVIMRIGYSFFRRVKPGFADSL